MENWKIKIMTLSLFNEKYSIILILLIYVHNGVMMINKREEKKEDIFFLFRNGRSFQVSKERWERSWLDWWLNNRNKKIKPYKY